MIKVSNNFEILVIVGSRVDFASHRTQDLIPAFIELLEEVNPRAHAQLIVNNAVPAYVYDEGDNCKWWDSEDASWLLNETLFEALNDGAPDGFVFGAHEGNGSDFGFWEDEEI